MSRRSAAVVAAAPAADAGVAPWTLPGGEVAARAGTDPVRGLEAGEAGRRLAVDGPNEVAQRAGTPVWRLVVGQLTDTMILVLLAAAVLTAAVGDLADTVVILGVVAVNTTLGVVQEVRAGRAIAALGSLTAPQARGVLGSLAADGTVLPAEIVHALDDVSAPSVGYPER